MNINFAPKKFDTMDPITKSFSKNASFEGGYETPIMAHETTVLIGTVILADFRAASKFCMAPYTNVARDPRMASLPVVTYLNSLL